MTRPLHVTVVGFAALADKDAALAAISTIFFEASGIANFGSEQQREAFCERWLLRYLTHFPQHTFVALIAESRIGGYLIGCLDNPAVNPRFSDISYFSTFAGLTARFPGHLHINLAGDVRGQGVGSLLLEAFADHARACGAPGIHAVTADGHRNNRFYERCGFARLASAAWNGRRIAFFGRELASSRLPEGDGVG